MDAATLLRRRREPAPHQDLQQCLGLALGFAFGSCPFILPALCLAEQLLEGKRLLERAIAERGNLAFETTLGGSTMTKLLAEAIDAGIDVHIWYVALNSPELHLVKPILMTALRGPTAAGQ